MAYSKIFPALLFLALLATSAFAVTQEWVARYNGPANELDDPYAIAVDASDNVYVTGSSYSVINSDYATVKYNSSGDQQWVALYDGPANSADRAYSIAVDASGNVYVTGASYSGTNYDYVTVKYDGTNGNQLWVAIYNGSANGDDYAQSIAVDGFGNVYVTGYSLGSGTLMDYATIKYNSSGDEQWVARYDFASMGDQSSAIAVDSLGNVYVTGLSVEAPNHAEYATVKYDSSGGQQWAARYSGTETEDSYADAVAVDSSGNVYVTGNSFGGPANMDCATVKYNSSGDQQWVERYNGSGNGDDYANAMALDSSANIYIAGMTYSGPGTNRDYVTIKYDTGGNQLWLQTYDGSASGDDSANSIAVDSSGSVYVSGGSPGSGTDADYVTVKYAPGGSQLWTARYDAANVVDVERAMAIGTLGTTYVTGISSNTTGKFAFPPDYATVKYFEDLVPPSVSAVSPTTVLNNTVVQYSVTATDNVAVASCDFYWDGINRSVMSNIGGDTWAAGYIADNTGSHYVWANCSDAAGNTNKTNTTMTANAIPPHTYSQDYDGSVFPAEYNQTFGGEQNASYDWANAVKIHVPTFTSGWLLLNLSMPSGATESTLAVFKYNDTNTTQMASGAYGEAGKYNVTGNRIYINITPGDPDFGGVRLPGGGTTGFGTAYAAPEADLFMVVALFCLAVLLLGAGKLNRS